MLSDAIRTSPVIPLVQSDDPAQARKISEALIAGGLRVLEVVLRSPGAMNGLEAVAKGTPDAIVGAGTVLNRAQAEEARRRGAEFIVSPGLDDGLIRYCEDEGVPIFPGAVTATEIQRAFNLGLRTVKFFPAALSGGPAAVKAFSSVFPEMQFMPTGGVSPDNLKDYLAVPAVIACGGSWLTPAADIEAGRFDMVTRLAREAVALAQDLRP